MPKRRPVRRGGVSFAAVMKGLQKADSIARAVKPASHAVKFLDSTGASRGKVGKVLRGIASFGQSFGYGPGYQPHKPIRRVRR